jgi:hypothetical protein
MNFRKLKTLRMKRLLLIFAILLASTSISNAQLLDGEKSKKELNKSTNNLILGIFNPANFSMNHRFEVSVFSSSYGDASVTSYINSMNYKFNDDLSISADVSLQYSPYANSIYGSSYSEQLKNDLSGVSLSRLSLDYKISDNSFLKIEYRNIKGSQYDYGFNDRYDRYGFGY